MQGHRVLTRVPVDLSRAVAFTDSPSAPTLRNLIETREAVVGVMGMGYVGLPLAVQATASGFKTLGFDLSSSRVNTINAGSSPIGDISDAELGEARTSGFEASADLTRLAECDVILIAVPTPLTKYRVPDLEAVETATRAIAATLRPGQLISLESTTYPGTTEEILRPILDASGLEPEKDYFLAHSPERIDPGNGRFNTKTTPKVVGGTGPLSTDLASLFYASTVDTTVPVSSANVAELVKIFENTFRAVNVALVNEMAQLCDRMELDVWEVLDAAFTKPFGIMPFYPGPGVGGHCIPLDPHYLEYKARGYNFETKFVNLAGEVNRSMPRFVVDKATRLLGDRGIALSQATIVICGVAYKKDQDDCRESPALDLIELLRHRNADVRYADPHVPRITIGNETILAQELTPQLIAEADLLIVATDHKSFDWEQVIDHANLILDTRNALKKVERMREKIVRL